MRGFEERQFGVGEDEFGKGFGFTVLINSAISVGGAIVESVLEDLDGIIRAINFSESAFGEIGGEFSFSEVG